MLNKSAGYHILKLIRGEIKGMKIESKTVLFTFTDMITCNSWYSETAGKLVSCDVFIIFYLTFFFLV